VKLVIEKRIRETLTPRRLAVLKAADVGPGPMWAGIGTKEFMWCRRAGLITNPPGHSNFASLTAKGQRVFARASVDRKAER
jgi:hypothetical protein